MNSWIKQELAMRVAECEALRARVRELVAENNALRGIGELSGQRNRRNGSSTKVLTDLDGEPPLAAPRDGDNSLQPEMAGNGQDRNDGTDDKINGLYTAGLTVREIQAHFPDRGFARLCRRR